MIGDHLTAVPPSDSSLDDVDTAFMAVILKTAERVAPPRTRSLQGRGWTGDAQAEAEINMTMAGRRVVGKRQKADKQDSQLKRAIRRENTHVHTVCDDAYVRFIERNIQGMEEDLRQHDQRGLFQRLMSLNIEDTRNVSSQYLRDKEGRMLRNPGLVLGRWAQFFGALLNANPDKLRLDIIEGLPQWPVTHAVGVKSTENESTGALMSMTNA